MQQIPLTADYLQQITTTLDGVAYDLVVRWNDMRGVWSMDIALSADGAPLAYGASLVLGGDILAGYALGIGAMVLEDTSGQGLDATEDDLGDRVVLYFVPLSELAA